MPGGLLDMFGIDPVANRQRQMQMQMLQQELANAVKLQEMRGTQGLEVERERGGQTRLTDTNKGKVDRETGKSATDNLARIKELEQELEMLKGSRMIGRATTPGGKVYEGSGLGDATVREQLQDTETDTGIKATPDYKNSRAAGMQAANLGPVFQNINRGAIQAPADTITAVPPSGISMPPALQQWPQLLGPSIEQGIQAPPMITLDNGRQVAQGDPTPFRKVTPGGITVPASPRARSTMPQAATSPSDVPQISSTQSVYPAPPATLSSPVALNPALKAYAPYLDAMNSQLPGTAPALNPAMEAYKQQVLKGFRYTPTQSNTLQMY